MIWDQLIGQQPAKDYLRASMAGHRLAHAYLFRGPAGTGKRTAAWLFAQAVLCAHPPAPDLACGECQSCRWLAARKGAQTGHPDMINLLKFMTGGGGSEKLVGDQEAVIRIETVQYVCEQLHRSPMAGQKRVLIVPEAQRLCRGQAEAANAFLKTLEEPPEAALVILTSSQPEALLETIVSRVQAVQFRRLASAEIREGLARQQALSGAELDLAVQLADGSLGRAAELLQGDLKMWRGAVLRALAGFGAKSCPSFGAGLWVLAEAEGKRLFEAEEAAETEPADAESEDDAGGDDRDEAEAKTEAGWKRYVFRRMLELCEVCFRDALVFEESGGRPDLLLQSDQAQLAQNLGRNFGSEGCQKALHALREALLAIRLYVRGDVVGRALAGRLAEALVSR